MAKRISIKLTDKNDWLLEAIEKASGTYGRFDEAVKKIAEDKPDIVIADEVIPGTDITDMVEGVSGNKNLRNVKFVLCSSKQHRNYLDFVLSCITQLPKN